MRYAIFSDIHGNAYAFEAALRDADAQGADNIFVIGDCTNSFPWGDRVADLMRSRSVTAVHGNGEGYLIDMLTRDVRTMKDEQFKPVYWACRTLSRTNYDYLTALPEHAVVTCGGDAIRLAHASHVFYRTPRPQYFSSAYIRELYRDAPFTHADYITKAKTSVLSDPGALADIAALPEGVHLFGHNHLQFHMEHEGRLFINPGSCGEALDYDASAAYTILEYANGRRNVIERRVPYNTEAVIAKLHSSGFAAYAPVWSDVLTLELRTGCDYFSAFVRLLSVTNAAHGQSRYPVSGEVWRAAVRAWNPGAV